MSIIKLDRKEEDNEPILWCSKCLSLAIQEEQNIDYCTNCGNTKIETSKIEVWLRLKRIRNHDNYYDFK